jgi:hypothetical protein
VGVIASWLGDEDAFNTKVVFQERPRRQHGSNHRIGRSRWLGQGLELVGYLHGACFLSACEVTERFGCWGNVAPLRYRHRGDFSPGSGP